MTRAFINRVKREMIVDTKKYRYICYEELGQYIITRIDINLLGYTACLDHSNWKTVYTE